VAPTSPATPANMTDGGQIDSLPFKCTAPHSAAPCGRNNQPVQLSQAAAALVTIGVSFLRLNERRAGELRASEPLGSGRQLLGWPSASRRQPSSWGAILANCGGSVAPPRVLGAEAALPCQLGRQPVAASERLIPPKRATD